MAPTIAVSILTADFLNLQKQLDTIIAAGIKAIHFDIMDYHFVPNLTFGPKILTDISNYLLKHDVVIDCHFMVEIKQDFTIAEYLAPFLVAKVNSVTIHYEALSAKQLQEFLLWKTKIKKGLAISPVTKITTIYQFLPIIDSVLIMSVNPGFGQQKFIEDTYHKISALKKYVNNNFTNKEIVIAVDGGINDKTGQKCLTLGANYLVAGSYLLNSNNSLPEQLEKLHHE